MRDTGRIVTLVAVLLGAVGVANSAKADGICHAGSLSAALASASPGDVVEVGACTVTGSFTVPAGVTLRGSGVLNTVIEASGDGVVLEAGAGEAALERVRVLSGGGVAVRVTGGGSAAVRDAAIVVSRGIGLAGSGAGSVAIEHVAFAGAVTASTAHTVPALATPASWPTHGIVLARVGHVGLVDVTLGGFARVGALVQSSDSDWVDVRAIGNVAVGIAVAGGTAEMFDVRAQSTWAGMLPPDEPAAGIAIVGRAHVRTTGLRVSVNEGFGVFHDRSGVVEHDDLNANGNHHAGVWAQSAGYLQLDDANLSRNDLGGVVAVDSGLVSIHDGRIERTNGDGVQLVRTEGDFTGLSLRNNTRVGLLADLATGATAADYAFTDVTVDGSGDALGVILQKDGAPLPLVTSGIRRRGVTAGNDAAFVGVGVDLGIVSGVQPQWLAALLPFQGATDNPE